MSHITKTLVSKNTLLIVEKNINNYWADIKNDCIILSVATLAKLGSVTH